MSEELALSIVTSWPSTKTELLDFLRKQSPDLGPFVCRDAAAIIEHLDSSLVAAEARVAALTQVAEAARDPFLVILERMPDGPAANAAGPHVNAEMKRAADNLRAALRALDGLVGLHEQEQE